MTKTIDKKIELQRAVAKLYKEKNISPARFNTLNLEISVDSRGGATACTCNTLHMLSFYSSSDAKVIVYHMHINMHVINYNFCI